MEGKQDSNDLLQAMSVGDHEGAKQVRVGVLLRLTLCFLCIKLDTR